MRAEQQALLQNGMRQMVPNMNGMTEQQMMRVQQQMFGLGMNGDLRKNAMNNRNQFQPYVSSCWSFIALWR